MIFGYPFKHYRRFGHNVHESSHLTQATGFYKTVFATKYLIFLLFLQFIYLLFINYAKNLQPPIEICELYLEVGTSILQVFQIIRD